MWCASNICKWPPKISGCGSNMIFLYFNTNCILICFLQGLYCSLRQLLEVGFFHADPHPGNLVATDDGSLAYFDFGMMGDIPRHYRVGLIRVVIKIAL